MNDADEHIIYQGRPSWLNYSLLYLIGIAIFLILNKAGDMAGGILILLFVIGLSSFFRFRYLFTVTEERVIARVGLIAKNTNEMQLNHIRAINVRQGVIERILGIGTAIFISAAEGEAAVVFKGIGDPQGVKERVRRL